MLLSRCLDKRDQGHEAVAADYTQAFLNAEVREGEQLHLKVGTRRFWMADVWCGKWSSNISETLAGTSIEHVERTRFRSR